MIDSKLITFINIAKLKNYTRVAEILNLTQPAVSQHIKQLEDYYEVKLIMRKGRQISLTEEGELLFRYAKELEANSVTLERLLKNKSAIIKRYNIGATLTIGEFVLPRLLGEYKEAHQNIDIIMHVYNLEEILKRLSSGEFDLGIVEGPFDKAKLNFKKLQDDELVLVASPLSSFSQKSTVDMSDVINEGKLIMREKGSATRLIFENKLLDSGLSLSDLNIYMEVGSIGAIKSLVQANLGYTVISKEAVKHEVSLGSLNIIPIQGIKIMREFNFIYPIHGQNDFIQEFMNHLINQNNRIT